MPTIRELPPKAFQKQDNGDKMSSMRQPVESPTSMTRRRSPIFFRATLPAGGVVPDLMSGWISHLPLEMAFAEVIDQGMNAEELSANSYPTRSFVQDLNRTQVLPFATGSCDAALCLVGVEYLQHSMEVFADVLRVLRPGAPFSCCSRLRSFPCAQENTKTELLYLRAVARTRNVKCGVPPLDDTEDGKNKDLCELQDVKNISTPPSRTSWRPRDSSALPVVIFLARCKRLVSAHNALQFFAVGPVFGTSGKVLAFELEAA